MGQWRREATRRSRDEGPPRSGPGRPNPYAGQVPWAERARVARVASGAEGMGLDTQVVTHGPFKRHGRVGMVVETCTNRSALLLSPDSDLAAARLDGYDNARFPIACLFRDAKPFTGLRDGQARAPAKRAVHGKMRLMAVTCATRAARQDANDQRPSFSMACRKRRDFTPPLMDRILTT